MAWTTPATWSVDQLVTATLMNTHIRDNLNALKAPPTDVQDVNEGADYTTTSTSFVDIDSAGDPDLNLTIETGGGDVLVTFYGTFANAGGHINLDFTVDGVKHGGDDGLLRSASTALGHKNLTFAVWVQGLSAASHTFKMQWKVDAGTATMYAGAGTGTGLDVHSQFAVREVS